MLLATAFTRHGIDLGDSVRDALDAVMAQRGGSRAGEAPPDPTSMLTTLADACEHDPFMIHTELSAMIAATPPEVQLTLLDALVYAEAPTMRWCRSWSNRAMASEMHGPPRCLTMR